SPLLHSLGANTTTRPASAARTAGLVTPCYNFEADFLDEVVFGRGIHLPVQPISLAEATFEALVARSIFWMCSEVVPKLQSLGPHCSPRLRDVHVMGATISVGRHALNEEHAVVLRVLRPKHVGKPT